MFRDKDAVHLIDSLRLGVVGTFERSNGDETHHSHPLRMFIRRIFATLRQIAVIQQIFCFFVLSAVSGSESAEGNRKED